MEAARTSHIRRQPEVTRATILKAAMAEFASAGVEGARTDEIARAAGVNKALLYYYFRDKEALYGAVLDEVYSGLVKSILGAMDSETDPKRRILAYAAAHFDYAAKSPFLPKLVSREMMRGSGVAKGTADVRRVRTPRHSSKAPIIKTTCSASPHLARIVEQFLKPLQARLSQTLAEGIRAGVFRQIDAEEFIPTMVGAIVFYFISLPVASRFNAGDPLSPERLAKRRAAVLDFISAALFRPESNAKSAGREI
jgi:TetR/AcrR family transcriptional regulator